jgi:hypothetical protein
LLRFWIGHTDKTITDTYSKVSEDVAFRQQIADQIGLGFKLESPIVRNVRRNSADEEMEIAA